MDEFCIGVELEGYWQGKAGFHLPGDDVSHEDFAEALVPVYNKIRGEDMLRAIFSEAPHAGHFENPKNQWAVTLDSGIGDELLDPKHRPKGHPIEFVSPVLPFGRSREWTSNLEKHWNTLSEFCTVEIDGMCATHVHISPAKERRWSLEPLKPFAKAVLYFDAAFNSIWAPSRRDHMASGSNKENNYKLKNLGFAECCELIDKCASYRELINLMQAGETTRDYAWNFENTDEKVKKSIGTIEFRCAPAVTNIKHSFIWVELAVSFAQATTKPDTSQVIKDKVYKDDAKGLKEFILRAGVDGMNNKHLLAIAFQKKWESDKQMRDAFDKSLKDMSTD